MSSGGMKTVSQCWIQTFSAGPFHVGQSELNQGLLSDQSVAWKKDHSVKLVVNCLLDAIKWCN